MKKEEKKPFVTFAESEVKFEIFCPNCMRYSRRVPGEAMHARVLDSYKRGNTEGTAVKCGHCEAQLLVKDIRI